MSAYEIEKTPINLPYGCEYAKSGRAKCRECNELIPQDTLRMAVRFQSAFFDGFQENWHHFECFWKKVHKSEINETSIKGIEWIKWDDQELIRQQIANLKTMTDKNKSALPKVDCAKTSAGTCFTCNERIDKSEVRISYKASYYHIECFKELNVVTSGAESISGYEILDDENKSKLEKVFPKKLKEKQHKRKSDGDIDDYGKNICDEPSTSKKYKTDEINLKNEARNKMLLKKQSDILWEALEVFKKYLSKDDVEKILVTNGFYMYKKEPFSKRLEVLADCAVFGISALCPVCNKGVLRYRSAFHRYQCNGFLTEFTPCMYTAKEFQRFPMIIPELSKNFFFLKKYETPQLSKRFYPGNMEHENIIEEPESFKSLNPAYINPVDGFDTVKSSTKIKFGCIVDPHCEIAEFTHVFFDLSNKRWQATLGSTDVNMGRNSFYKLQLLKHDDYDKYYLFRKWGRLGTSTANTKLDDFGLNVEKARRKFEQLFLEKTLNEWRNSHNFQKHPFGMTLIEMEILSDELSEENLADSLQNSLKRLIALIFDVNAMNNIMKEFEINLDVMPLGNLSEKTILRAYKLLTNLQKVLEDDCDVQRTTMICVDASNQFYTMIPHNTGSKTPPILNNVEIIKSKIILLDNLLDIQLSYSFIKKNQEDGPNLIEIIDKHYKSLNCEIQILSTCSGEFKLIKKYAENTYVSTDNSFKLEIVDVFKINREGEAERFKNNIGNRYLLWHGSRITNYVSILNQGLKIALPEASMAGYMFGKGIYLADMVSKSAYSCNTDNTDCLMLLCETALGEIKELYSASNISNLEPEKNSVKGMGSIIPDPKDIHVMADGVIVPYGKPIDQSLSQNKNFDLRYNEYVVYDEAQIKMKYLVRFKYVLQNDDF